MLISSNRAWVWLVSLFLSIKHTAVLFCVEIVYIFRGSEHGYDAVGLVFYVYQCDESFCDESFLLYLPRVRPLSSQALPSTKISAPNSKKPHPAHGLHHSL